MKRFVEGEDRRQATLLPDSLEDYVTEDNPVRVVDVFIDELDLEALGFSAAAPEVTGQPAYHPATLLKIYLYGYPTHFRTKVLPELARVPGFLGAQLSKRQLGDTIEFLVLTRWRTISAIQDFAGSDIAKATVEPGAIAALIDFDARVLHYEVIEDVVPEDWGRLVRQDVL